MQATQEPEVSPPRPDDDHSAFAREVHGLHPAWQWGRISRLPDDAPEGQTKLTGAAFEPMKAGKRKGSPNYQKAIPGTERTLFVVNSELQAWRDRREAETGVCQRCHGDGEVWAGSGIKPDGTTYKRTRPCVRCEGTGKFQPSGE